MQARGDGSVSLKLEKCDTVAAPPHTLPQGLGQPLAEPNLPPASPMMLGQARV